MKKGNSNKQPESIERYGNKWQVRWDIKQNDKTDEDGNTVESWDYYFANCDGNSYEAIIEGIIRSAYSQSQVEAILANYLEGNDNGEYIQFQQFRKLAKAVAGKKSTIDAENAVVNDRVGDVEQTISALIESLNEKNIIP